MCMCVHEFVHVHVCCMFERANKIFFDAHMCNKPTAARQHGFVLFFCFYVLSMSDSFRSVKECGVICFMHKF